MTSTLSLPGPGSFGAWLLAARPQTLPVALAPVAVGTAVASTLGPVRWGVISLAGEGMRWKSSVWAVGPGGQDRVP